MQMFFRSERRTGGIYTVGKYWKVYPVEMPLGGNLAQ